MRPMKKTNVLPLALISTVILVCLAGLVIVAGTTPAESATTDGYAIYLSHGPTKGVPYGGYHVTITDFSNKAFTKKMKDDVKKAWTKANNNVPDQPYHLKTYTIKFIDKEFGYGMFFDSPLLTKFAGYLIGYKEFSGVKTGNWHISLHKFTLMSALLQAEKIDEKLMTLWEVHRTTDKKGKTTYTWTHITTPVK